MANITDWTGEWAVIAVAPLLGRFITILNAPPSIYDAFGSWPILISFAWFGALQPMLTFCTLFDSRYLAKGLALYESLAKHTPDFRLYVFGLDDSCCDVLDAMHLPNLVIIRLSEFEDEKLLQAKHNRSSTEHNRSSTEYYWTCASSTILYVLENYTVDSCTYLDADIYFYDNPECLLREIGKNSVLITSHRYTSKYDRAEKYGKYCAPFMTFKNDENGLLVLRWWRSACLDWCYARVEDGKFGDQKYLDDWPARFSGIHELKHLGGGVAPWNVQQYEIDCRNLRLREKGKTSQVDINAVFYHLHAVKFYENGKLDLGRYDLSIDVIKCFYKPYVRHLDQIGEKIALINDSIDPHGVGRSRKTGGFGDWREHLRRLQGRNIFKLSSFVSEESNSFLMARLTWPQSLYAKSDFHRTAISTLWDSCSSRPRGQA